MKTIIFVVALTLLSLSSLASIASAGERRYVVSTKSYGITFNEYALWTNATWYRSCTRAVTGGGSKADQQRFCTDGFDGIKPKVGVVVVGDEIELLDSRECAPMVGVRVLTGKLKSETGCLADNALSSFKP